MLLSINKTASNNLVEFGLSASDLVDATRPRGRSPERYVLDPGWLN